MKTPALSVWLAGMIVLSASSSTSASSAKVDGLDVLPFPAIEEPRSRGPEPVADTCAVVFPWERPPPKPFEIPIPETTVGGQPCGLYDAARAGSKLPEGIMLASGITVNVNIGFDIGSVFCAVDRAAGRFAARWHGVPYSGGAYCGLAP